MSRLSQWQDSVLFCGWIVLYCVCLYVCLCVPCLLYPYIHSWTLILFLLITPKDRANTMMHIESWNIQIRHTKELKTTTTKIPKRKKKSIMGPWSYTAWGHVGGLVVCKYQLYQSSARWLLNTCLVINWLVSFREL